MGYQKTDDALWSNLAESDLCNLAYVARYGQNDSEMAFFVRNRNSCAGIICDTRDDGDHQKIVG